MKKFFLKVILATVIGLLVLLGALFAYLYSRQEALSALIIREINKQLEVEVAVSGVETSLRKFPNASLVFTDVFSEGAYSQPGDTLIFAQKIYLQFNIWEILFSSVSIHRIAVEDGVLKIDKKLSKMDNYRIWKKDTVSSSQLFTLERVDLHRLRTHIREEASGLRTRFYCREVSFSGTFEPAGFLLEQEGVLDVNQLQVGEEEYLKNITLRLAFLMQGDSATLNLREGELQWEDIPIAFDMHHEGDQTRLNALAQALPLAEVQRLATAQDWFTLRQIDVSGEADLSFQTLFNTGAMDQTELTFSVYNGALEGYRDTRIQNISTSGTYTRQGGKSHINLKRFEGKGRTGHIQGDLQIRPLEHPLVRLNLRSDLELAEWFMFFPLDTLEEVQGKAIVDLHFENRFKDLRSIRPEELHKARATGQVQIEKASFRFAGSTKKVEGINGALAFKGNTLNIKRLFLKTGRSDIYLEGYLKNVLNFLVIQEETLRVDARVRAQEVDLDDFVAVKQGSSSPGYDLSFTRALDVELQVEVGRLVFQKFFASDFKGTLNIKDQHIKVPRFTLKADKGLYRGQFEVNARNPESYSVQAKLDAQDINLQDAFISFHEFGQEALSSKHISGTATLLVDFKAQMTPDLEIDTRSIALQADVEIHDGRLKNYEPLQALSRFADLEELKDVRFRSLTNTISIRNSEIHIPRMDIQSNVLSLQLSGVHAFDNAIDYSLRLKLDDILLNRKRKKAGKSEFEEHLVEKKKDDDPYIYLKMSGTVDDPVIALDRQSLGRSISKEFKEQGKEVQSIFKPEPADTVAPQGPGIIFEWEENKEGEN